MTAKWIAKNRKEWLLKVKERRGKERGENEKNEDADLSTQKEIVVEMSAIKWILQPQVVGLLRTKMVPTLISTVNQDLARCSPAKTRSPSA